MKADLAALCIAHGLPRPVAEYRFHPTRKWRMDYAWPENPVATALNFRLAIEVEGGAFMPGGGRHSRGAGMRADLEKYQAALDLHWIVYRILPEWLGKQSTIDTIRRLLVTP